MEWKAEEDEQEKREAMLARREAMLLGAIVALTYLFALGYYLS